ncbi:MAG: hypothetical protein ACK5Y6_06800 [Pseudomonadota bacterium]|jgi:hypothetical protein
MSLLLGADIFSPRKKQSLFETSARTVIEKAGEWLRALLPTKKPGEPYFRLLFQ